MTRYFILILVLLSTDPIWALSVSLNPTEWMTISYPKINANTVKQAQDGLHIFVNNSSSAQVYKFEKPISLKEVKIKAHIKGEIKYGLKIPGSKQADDFPLRLGFILKGKNKLNFFQKAIAPDWLIELNSMSSKFGGLDKVYSLIFYTTKPNFKKREHPFSSYFFEQVGGSFKNPKLDEIYKLSIKNEVIGLWLSSDGDDTNSSFEVIVESIDIN